MRALSSIESYVLSNDSSSPIVMRENEFADIRNDIVADVLTLRNIDEQSTHARLFQLAGIGSTDATNVKDAKHRGDFRCWLLPSVCAEYDLHGCRELIERITRMCSKGELKQSLGLNGEYSVQVTKYPGNGAHYVRHLDTAGGATGTTITNSSSSSSQRHRGVRKLTFIFYLNPLSCDGDVTSATGTGNSATVASTSVAANRDAVLPTGMGGQLRVYGIPACASVNTPTVDTSTSNASTATTGTYMDIEPTLGTLVIFRSDKVEHEVMPTFRDRWAITVWAYADDAPIMEAPAASIAGRCAVAAVSKTAPRPVLSAHDLSKKAGGVHLNTLLGLLQPQWHRTYSDRNIDNCDRTSHVNSAAVGPPPPPISTATTTASGASGSTSIFVSIISYRDSELPHTVLDLFNTAANPANVYVGIVYQIDSHTDIQECLLRPDQLSHLNGVDKDQHGGVSTSPVPTESVRAHPAAPSLTNTLSNTSADSFYSQHIRTLTLPHTEAKGPTYARSLAASLYREEKFVLQIDSHMRFRRNWDVYLIDTLESLRNGRASDGSTEGTCPFTSTISATGIRECKPVLTTYPQGYHLPNKVPCDTRPTVLMPSRWDENGFLRQEGKLLCIEHGTPQPKCVRSPLWAAGFSFSSADVVREVPYSPLLPHLFFGEELSMAARLYTHGYDLFAPSETVCYHLYSRAHRPTFQELQRPTSAPAQAPTQVQEPPVAHPHPPSSRLPAPPALPANTNVNTSARPGTSAGQIATEKTTSQCLLQYLLDLPVHPTHRALCRTPEFARLQEWQQCSYGLGKVRSLQDFKHLLTQVGVTFPSTAQSTDTEHSGTTVGSVSVDVAQRLQFVCSDQPELLGRLRFAQSGMHDVSIPDGIARNGDSASVGDGSTPVVPECMSPTPVLHSQDLSKLLSAAGALERIQQFL